MGFVRNVEDASTKIDDLATDGLEGTPDSLAYRVHEIERHLHGWSRCFEAATVASGEVHVADRIGNGAGAIRIDAGNDDWGAWVQILGSSDTPTVVGLVAFDFDRISIEGVEREATYFIQVAFGASGAAALAAGTYSEFIYIPLTNKKEPSPLLIKTRRVDAGAKTWARCKCPGQNTAWLDTYSEIHEYEG